MGGGQRQWQSQPQWRKTPCRRRSYEGKGASQQSMVTIDDAPSTLDNIDNVPLSTAIDGTTFK